jgi:transcriptional regulator with XRE-family HTH domain
MGKRRVPDNITEFQRRIINAKLRVIQEEGNPDISDAELARRCHVNSVSFSQWKNGDRIPDLTSTTKLVDSGYFDDSLYELLGHRNPHAKETDADLIEKLKDPIFNYVYKNIGRIPYDKLGEIYRIMKEQENDQTSEDPREEAAAQPG